MVGDEQQSRDLIGYLSGEDPEKLWQSNIFGKSVYDLIQEGLTAKLIGLPEDVAHGALRFTLGRDTTKADIDFTVDRMKEVIGKIRAMSPYYAKFAARDGKE